MNKTTEYVILRVLRSYSQKPADETLSELVNKKLSEDFEPLGRPFFGEEAMYQAMVKSSQSNTQSVLGDTRNSK